MISTQNENAFKLCSADELFRIRTTLFTILRKNNFEILYGPDYQRGWIQAEFFQKWKTLFLETKLLDNRNPTCPPEFELAEDFLSIVAKGHRDQDIVLLILFAKSGSVRKEEIGFYESYIKENKVDRCWVVAEICTSQSKNTMQQIAEEPSSVKMRFIPYAKLKSDWTENIYVHRYQVLAKKEQEEKKLKETDKFPKILISDSACIQTLANIGDILISTGPSVTAGEISQMKKVIAR